MATTTDTEKGGGGGPNCLLCTEVISYQKEIKGDKGQRVTTLLYGENSTSTDLKSQLSAFFLLRKVLSLPQDFLENLLTQCGSPAEWSICLCRHCSRLFKEAEHLWDRLKQLQKDFDTVTTEIKDVITKSMNPDEEKFSKKDGSKAKKSLVESKLKSSEIKDCVRKAFFLSSKDASCTKSPTPNLSNSSLSSYNSGLLNWNENGVPYLSLADFENKMRKLVETVAATPMTVVQKQDQKEMKETSTQTLDASKQSSITPFVSVSEDTNENEVEMEFELEDEDPLSINEDMDPLNITNSNSSTIISIPFKPSNVPTPTEPESTIRIVKTSTLMEPEDDESDSEAAPHIIGILKCDPDAAIEMDSGDSLPDPLEMETNDDKDDPDYVPDDSPPESSKQPSTTTNGKENKTKNEKAEETPSKLISLSIQAYKLSSNVYECSKCKQEFDARVGCQSHILRDHYNDRQPFHCHVCSVKYSMFQQLKEHVRNSHAGIATPYDNDFNPATDYITLEVSKIIQAESKTPPERRVNVPLYSCHLCPQKFSVKRNVVRHGRTVHNVKVSLSDIPPPTVPNGEQSSSANNTTSNDQDFSCGECEKLNIIFKASSREYLEIHMRRHHGANSGGPNTLQKKLPEKPPNIRIVRKQSMKCPDCKKLLPSVTAMAEHLKNPENKCKQCTKHFLFDMDLKRHVEMEHTRGNSFQCPFCPKVFSAQIIYEKHVENHQIHDVHECEFCHTKFTGFANLHRHMEIHADLIAQQQQQEQQQLLLLQQDPLAFSN